MLQTKPKAHLFDVVEVAEDLPEYGVKRGNVAQLQRFLTIRRKPTFWNSKTERSTRHGLRTL